MAMLGVLTLSTLAKADYAIYTIPGTDVQIPIAGETHYNPGGTVTHRHPRGTLYFGARDIRVIKVPTPEQIYAKKYRKVVSSKNVDEMIELAAWTVRNGMLAKCKALLGEAWKIDPEHPRLKKLAAMVQYIHRPVSRSTTAETHLTEYVKGSDMVISPSKHFILLHNRDIAKDPVTKKSRAEMRLELLEQVYETFFLTFAFNGVYLRPPVEPMEVVLFTQHADFLSFASHATGSRSVAQLAGFYKPDDNVAIFYDNATDKRREGLIELVKAMRQTKEDVKRTRIAGAGEVIRLINALELLIDIEREAADVATVSHECVHQLAANTGMFPRDGYFIRWVHEGLASYFESSTNGLWRGAGVVDHDRIDYYRILEGDPVRGSLEFIVSDLGFLVEASLGDQLPAYGQAWALTHFLINKHFDELVKFYKATHDLKESEEETLKERNEKLLAKFQEVFPDLPALELEWRRYMRGLKPTWRFWSSKEGCRHAVNCDSGQSRRILFACFSRQGWYLSVVEVSAGGRRVMGLWDRLHGQACFAGSAGL